MKLAFSMCGNACATDCREADALAVLAAVRNGKWRGPVEAVRAEYVRAQAEGRDPKEAVDALKKALPGVLVSGVFSRRQSAALLAHSGLLCADLDSLGERLPAVRAKIEAEPHVYAVFLSPTGTGLKAWFRVRPDAAQHAASFRAVAERVRAVCGADVDQACKDVARLCFVSFDPEAFINANAAELAPMVEPAKPALPVAAPSAPHNGNGTLPPSVDRLLATGAQVGERNAQAFKVACQLRDSGLSEAEAETRLLEFASRCSPPLATREALATLRSAYATPARPPARNPARPAAAGGDEAEFARLAALPPAHYDREREAVAERLGIRTGTLDAEVASRRPGSAGKFQGGAVEFAKADPWPQPVDGAEVLSAVAATFRRYVALPATTADALALWVAHAHAFEAFQHSPRLNLASPEKQCGKALVLDLAAALLPRPLRTESITPAVLFRLVELHKPCLLLDEVDTYLAANDELRGLLNAGHKRGAKAYRCEGDGNEVRGFNAFAPAVLAGIGALPGTLHDRSVVVRLVRAKPGEVPARFDSRRTAAEAVLCRQLARWTADNLTRLESCDPDMPGAFNRLADNWRPLFAVAEVAGGDWPQRATAALAALTGGDDQDAHGVGTALLADVRTIFAAAGTDRLPSARIVEPLATLDGKPWPEFGKGGKPITANQLAKLLGRFGIRSRTIRTGDDTAKGYHREDFEDTFARYLPTPPPVKPSHRHNP